jgi:hypothetical protein
MSRTGIVTEESVSGEIWEFRNLDEKYFPIISNAFGESVDVVSL